MAVIIRSSSLHGAGVYTTSFIAEGTRILEYTGPRLRARQTDGMYSDSEVTYLFGMDDGKTVIDGFGMAAFVNHSCRPNCETDQIDNRIDLRQVPVASFITGGGPVPAMLMPPAMLPAVPMKRSDFWAQGVNFGVEFKF